MRIHTRRVHSVGSNVANSIRFSLFVGSDFFDSIGRPSNVEYLTFDGGQYRIGNRIESFCTPLIYIDLSVKFHIYFIFIFILFIYIIYNFFNELLINDSDL